MKEVDALKIVAVVGAGHVNGIIELLNSKKEQDLKEIEIVPPPSNLVKIIGYGIPTIIIASLFYIGFTKGAVVAGDSAIFWVLANGIPSAWELLLLSDIHLLLLQHSCCPITSLTPVIGADMWQHCSSLFSATQSKRI